MFRVVDVRHTGDKIPPLPTGARPADARTVGPAVRSQRRPQRRRRQGRYAVDARRSPDAVRSRGRTADRKRHQLGVRAVSGSSARRGRRGAVWAWYRRGPAHAGCCSSRPPRSSRPKSPRRSRICSRISSDSSVATEVTNHAPTTPHRRNPPRRLGHAAADRCDGPANEQVDRPQPAPLEARDVSAWFGDPHVLDRVSLLMEAGEVTALIGPSGCGKSTFLRILNRMHEMTPAPRWPAKCCRRERHLRLVAAHRSRQSIGMVFQKPNPFPAMSIYDNVLAGLKLTGTGPTGHEGRDRRGCLAKGRAVERSARPPAQPGGALSGGQQQRLCIARALAVRPQVLLMDEPCSALDPTSTRRSS